MANILVKSGKEENLHKIMEVLEGVAERTVELEGKVGQSDDMTATISRLEEKCRELDKRLPKGSKTFVDGSVSRTGALYNFGKVFSAAWRLRKYGELQEGFTRASGDPGQKNASNVATGSVLVPTQVYGDVIRIVTESSIIRKIATVIPMSATTMNVPTRSSGPNVYWAASEGAGPGTQSSVVFGAPTLTSKTLIAIDEISSELDEDSIVALEPFFAQVFAEAVAAEENKQAFSSSTPFTGVVQDVNTNLNGNVVAVAGTQFSNLTYAKLVELQYKIDSNCIGNGVWVMNSQAFKEVAALTDTQGRPIFATGYSGLPTSVGMADPSIAQATMLMGRPCYLTNALASSVSAGGGFAAIYGDFSKFAFGDRRALSVEFSDQVFFEYGTTALRVTERIALKALILSAFAVAKVAAA